VPGQSDCLDLPRWGTYPMKAEPKRFLALFRRRAITPAIRVTVTNNSTGNILFLTPPLRLRCSGMVRACGIFPPFMLIQSIILVWTDRNALSAAASFSFNRGKVLGGDALKDEDSPGWQSGDGPKKPW